jgi:hypothetical protein
MEAFRPQLGHPFDDAHARRCAGYWAVQLRRQGISDTAEEDLLQEAWRLARARLSSGEVVNPVAFACTVIERIALMRMRRHRNHPEQPLDPATGALSLRPAPDGWLDDLETRMLVEETLRHLERDWNRIRSELTAALGEPERMESIRAAATRATTHLLLQDTGWSIDETLSTCMDAADEWWRVVQEPGESLTTAMERTRKRIARDRPWVSYLTLWVALRWALQSAPTAAPDIARHHLRHVRILLREVRTNEQRRSALERHITRIERAIGGSSEANNRTGG